MKGHVIVFDAKLKRPACALIQAFHGCDHRLCHRFPVESWLTSPTPDMRRYRATDAELDRLVEIVETDREHRKGKHENG